MFPLAQSQKAVLGWSRHAARGIRRPELLQPTNPKAFSKLSFSISTRSGTRDEPKLKSKPENPTTTDTHELPKFSFDGLGLSKNMKIGILVLLSIFGTIETWFWYKAAMRWWKGEGE